MVRNNASVPAHIDLTATPDPFDHVEHSSISGNTIPHFTLGRVAPIHTFNIPEDVMQANESTSGSSDASQTLPISINWRFSSKRRIFPAQPVQLMGANTRYDKPPEKLKRRIGPSLRRTGASLKRSMSRTVSSVVRRSRSLSASIITRHSHESNDTSHASGPESSASPPAPICPPPAVPVCPPSVETLIQDIPNPTGSQTMPDSTISLILQTGIPMIKVTKKSFKRVLLRLDPDQGHVVWETKGVLRIIPIEWIKEFRTEPQVPLNGRRATQLGSLYDDCWMTIIYVAEGGYKTVHFIAPSREIHEQWLNTLLRLHSIRKDLMAGLHDPEFRQAIFEKQVWRAGDEERDQRLTFDEAVKLCRRLNINSGRDDLRRLFEKACQIGRDYLSFDDFRLFVKLLKERPEVERIFIRELKAQIRLSGRDPEPGSPRHHSSFGSLLFQGQAFPTANIRALIRERGQWDFDTFSRFLKDIQHTHLNGAGIEQVWERYSKPLGDDRESDNESAQSSTRKPITSHGERCMNIDLFTTFLLSSDNLSFYDTLPEDLALEAEDDTHALRFWPHLHPHADHHDGLRGHANGRLRHATAAPDMATAKTEPARHPMTYSLSAYFISASHNTYLVGHQLVGESTIEGYIRALLAGCRSVEVDIYDGPTEPMIFHGKTLTSKVSLRQVCEAIHKYGFVASPYPIIISAEMHCGLVQQDMVAQIMMSIFGDALVRRREFVPEAMALELKSSSPRGTELHRSPTVEDVEFRQATVQFLPSPEDLKGRILLKTRNFYVSGSRSDVEGDVSTEPSASSTSDSDAFEAQLHRSIAEEFSYRRDISPGGIKDITRSMYDRVRGKTREPPPPVGPVGTIMAPSPVTLSSSLSGDSALGWSSPQSLSPTPNGEVSRVTGQHTGTNAKPKMAPMLRSTLVFTAGVKFRGINKKEEYAPEHMFSLSERVINRILKSPDETYSLIKHCRDHMVRVYPKGIRVTSTNYEPHRFWAAGAQLVALNWQTFDDGYMMNNAMFQRNDGLGYVLKPRALRCNTPSCKALLSRKTLHNLKITIISAQQLPRPRDSSGKDGFEKGKAAIIDPFVELSLFTPDWDNRLSGSPPHSQVDVSASSPFPACPREVPRDRSGSVSSQPRRYRTSVVKNNGFNPVWEESFCLPFLCQGGMVDLVFLKILIKREDKEDEEPVALHCSSLGSLARGYRHLPLYDAQLSQYLFATLFVKIEVEDI